MFSKEGNDKSRGMIERHLEEKFTTEIFGAKDDFNEYVQNNFGGDKSAALRFLQDESNENKHRSASAIGTNIAKFESEGGNYDESLDEYREGWNKGGGTRGETLASYEAAKANKNGFFGNIFHRNSRTSRDSDEENE